jgi:hypothetical protein
MSKLANIVLSLYYDYQSAAPFLMDTNNKSYNLNSYLFSADSDDTYEHSSIKHVTSQMALKQKSCSTALGIQISNKIMQITNNLKNKKTIAKVILNFISINNKFLGRERQMKIIYLKFIVWFHDHNLHIDTLHIKGLQAQNVSAFQPSSVAVHAPLTYLFFSLHWPMFTYSVFVIYILVQ